MLANSKFLSLQNGAIAQLARASRWQREGLGFESP